MPRPTTRTLNAFAIHGHQQPGNDNEAIADYESIFDSLLVSPPTVSRFVISGDTVAVTRAERFGSQYAFRFVSGNEDDSSFVYDERTGVDEEVDAGVGRYFVNGVWLFVDQGSRVVVIESRRPGVPRYQIEAFFSHYGREVLGMHGLTISLHPIPSSSFFSEIDSFEVIKEATLVLRRPNKSWSKTAEGLLGNLPASNAEQISLSAKSSRGESLNSEDGLVKEIKKLKSRAVSALYNAIIRGRRGDFEGERTVSLLKHMFKTTVTLPTGGEDADELTALREGALQLESDIRDDHSEDDELNPGNAD